MQNLRELPLRSDEGEPFVTIDDVAEKARELFDDLARLGEYKHPLAVRRGVRSIMPSTDSEQMKGAGRTYFFDLRKTKEGKSFLTVTESRKDSEGKFVRGSIAIFPEDKEAFANILTAKLAEI
jgi:hypothetical protein